MLLKSSMRDSFLAVVDLSIPISSSKAFPPSNAFDFPLPFHLDALVPCGWTRDSTTTSLAIGISRFDDVKYAPEAPIFVLLESPLSVDWVFHFCSLRSSFQCLTKLYFLLNLAWQRLWTNSIISLLFESLPILWEAWSWQLPNLWAPALILCHLFYIAMIPLFTKRKKAY